MQHLRHSNLSPACGGSSVSSFREFPVLSWFIYLVLKDILFKVFDVKGHPCVKMAFITWNVMTEDHKMLVLLHRAQN
jgi:hypothetical protein